MQVQDSYSAQKACAECPDVFPNRLQHFEYESISFNCEVLDGSLAWAVKRKSSSGNITCGTNWGHLKGSSCLIRDVYIEDSGEYWCETKDGKKSKSVNIVVTTGSVILDIPVAPVTEGEAVTLNCRNKTPSNISASFYKNGILMKNVSTGNLMISSVSKCDEGLYKCISRAGASPESWLTVKEPIPLCSDQLPVLLYFLIRTVATVLWVAMLLLVLRKRHSGKDRKWKLFTVTYFIFSLCSVYCSESQWQDSMVVTALCIGLLVDVLLLLTTEGQNYVHKADAVFLHVVPNRLQFFEYESISFNCTGFHGPTEWRVMKKIFSDTSRWETSTGYLNIQPAFVSHSGEYWCEEGEGERSNSVNITIKGGGVILESPALPVMEQQTVTLRCRLKGTSSNLSADFIKDGHVDKVGYAGEMTIYNVSKSDEGLYRCRISGRGESAESWLAVRESQRSHQKLQGSTSVYFSPTPQLGQETSHPQRPGSIQLSTLLSVVFTILCVAVLLLVVGILQCRKYKVACFSSEMPATVSDPVSAFPASEHTHGDDPRMTLYGRVTKPKKKRACEHTPIDDDPCVTIYDDVTAHEEKKKKVYEHTPVDDPCVTIYDVTTHEEKKKKKRAYEHTPVDDPCVTIYDDVTTHEETTKRGHRKEKHLRDGRQTVEQRDATINSNF